MPHGPLPNRPSFVPTHPYTPPCSRCGALTTKQTRPRAVSLLPDPRAVPHLRTFQGTAARQLRISSFAAHQVLPDSAGRSEESLHDPHVTPDNPPVVCAEKQKRPVPRLKPQKLFLLDAEWLIEQTYDSNVPDCEPQFLRKFSSALLKFLNAKTEKHPVVVVFPHYDDFIALTNRSSPRAPGAHETEGAQPADLIPVLKKLCRALGVAAYDDDIHESREVVAGLATKSSASRIPVVIISADTAFLQLLASDKVSILKPEAVGKFARIAEDLLTDATHGLQPHQIIDLLALIGKKGMVKPVPGIQPQLAPLLVSRFGSIEAIFAAAKGSSGRTRTQSAAAAVGDFDLCQVLSPRALKSLLQHEVHVLRAKRIISIDRDVRITMCLNDLRKKPVHRTQVTQLIRDFGENRRKQVEDMELGKISDDSELSQAHGRSGKEEQGVEPLSRMLSAQVSASEETDATAIHELPKRSSLRRVENPLDGEVREFLSGAGSQLGLLPVFGKDKNGEVLIGLAVARGDGQSMYVDLRTNGNLPEPLIEILEGESEKRGTFLRELYKYMLTRHGITVKGLLFDLRVAMDLLHADEKTTREILAAVSDDDAQIHGLLSTRTGYDTWYSAEQSTELCSKFNRLSDLLRDKLDEEGLLSLAVRVEFPLIPVLGSMEIDGVPLDRTELLELRSRYKERFSKIENKIRANLLESGASSALAGAAIDKAAEKWLALHGGARQKATLTSARPTSTRNGLERMASNRKLPEEQRILAYLFTEREDLSKFVGREIASLLRYIDQDGRVRASFLQGSSSTGRLATRNPNLQNIPVRSQLGRDLRNAFRAERGKSMLRADYSQIELRIVGSLCGDSFMLEAFSSGADIHRSMASKLFQIPISKVTNFQRNQAKQVIYSILYGISSAGLSERLGIPVREAENLLSEFKIEFPAVQELANNLVEEASKVGYAKTLLGRRLPLPQLVRGEPSEKRAASRKAINMPIQGTQADMIKLSMVRIHERLRATKASSKLVLQIHDELILEVAGQELDIIASLVEEEMISALPLTGVDVAVQIRCGPSWSTCSQPIFSRG